MIFAPRRDSRILAAGAALPDHVVAQEEAVRALAHLFPREDSEEIRCMVLRSGVRERHIVRPLPEVLEQGDFTSRNARYRGEALELASQACRTALERSGLYPWDIDVLIDVSCTGITIPALDVSIVPAIGLRRDVRRIPITEAGCAGGALAINVAASLAQGGARVLLVAVELCSLTLCHDDQSRTNLIAALLFGDGAAAAVIGPEGSGPRIRAVGSQLIPDTQGIMGFDVGAHGLRIVLQRELPSVVAEHLPLAIDAFLAQHGVGRQDIDLHLVHPGGRSILDAYQERFGLAAEDLRFSRGVLAECGNLSSASILAVLERALYAERGVGPVEQALLVAVGPGLSLEMALLDWNPEGGPRP